MYGSCGLGRRLTGLGFASFSASGCFGNMLGQSPL